MAVVQVSKNNDSYDHDDRQSVQECDGSRGHGYLHEVLAADED